MVSNIKIGFATDSMTFTPTEAFSYSNGYDYFFPNGQELASVIEENTPSIATGFSYGSTPRTNTFKATASGSMAQIKVLEKYTHIAVYKDGSLVFCGYNPTFSKTIKKGVGAQGTDESYVVAQMSFSDYSGSLKDVTFSSSEEFDLYYTSSDNIKVCNTSDTSHSLIHILLGYLDPNHRFTVHFGNMPSILANTKVTYFSVTYEDKVLSIIKDVLEQAGLAMYFDRMHIYIIDVLEELSGTAINIADIESDAVKKGRSFVEISIPTILMATARFVTDVTVYDSGEMNVSGDDWYYPAEDTLAEGSFSYSAKEDDEKEKRYFNFREKDFYGEHGLLGYGNDLVYFSRTSTGLKYRVKNDSALRRKFRLKQKADVLLFKYATAFTPTENWNKEESECDYIYSNEMAQRYANALMYQKKSQAVYIDFYADTTSQYPNGYPINSVISLQGTDEVNPLFLITTKTDKLDPFGGYTYRAIPYERGNVQLSSNYVESKEGLPQYDGKFTAYVSRDVIVCHSNHTPKDTTPVQVVVNIKDRTVVPVLTVNGNEVAIQREKVPVITEGGTEYADTDNWIYEIEANLFGYDTCQLQVTVGDESWTSTISKSADTDSVAPPIIVPEGYTLVTQFCYGTEHNPAPRWVEDASYTLEDASSLVSDIYWVDAVDGVCPLRPRVGMYIWMRQGIYTSPATEPSSWTVSLYDTPYLQFDFNVSQNTYIKDDRSRQTNDNTIYIYPLLFGYDATSLVVTASNKTSPLSYDSTNQRYTLIFNRKGAPENGITITATLGAMQWSTKLACDNQTLGPVNLGARTTLPTRIYNGQDVFDGDYFIPARTFGVGAHRVTPSGNENPSALGWYYYYEDSYFPTADTTVVSGTTYYTVDETYTKGYPYVLDESEWVLMEAVAENFDQMLSNLATILDNPSAQPDDEGSPLYLWAKNLTALQAIIKFLTVGNITIDRDVTDSNNVTHNFKFLAHTYAEDGTILTVPVFDIIYDNTKLLTVDVTNGAVSMNNANINGKFTSNGFETQDASSTHSISNVGVSTANAFYMYDFHLSAIESLRDNVTYIQTSSSEYSRTFYSNTSGKYKNTSYTKIGLANDPRYTYATIQSSMFSTSSPFSGSVHLLEDYIYLVSCTLGTCLVYVDSYYDGKENTIEGVVKSVASTILGNTSGSMQFTAINIASELFHYFDISNANLSTVVYNSSSVWSSNSDDSLYHYNLSSINMDSSYCSFTGTVNINGTTVINTSTANQYYIKKSSDHISIANASNVVLYTISEYNSVSWNLNISVAGGVSGIKAMNVLPYDTSTSKVGTSALPFAEGNFGKMTTPNAVITGGTQVYSSDIRQKVLKDGFDGFVPVFNTKNKIEHDSFDSSNKQLMGLEIGQLGICVGKKTRSLTVTLPSGSGSYSYSALSVNCYYNGANGVQVRSGSSVASGTQVSLGYSDAGKPYGVIFIYWRET